MSDVPCSDLLRILLFHLQITVDPLTSSFQNMKEPSSLGQNGQPQSTSALINPDRRQSRLSIWRMLVPALAGATHASATKREISRKKRRKEYGIIRKNRFRVALLSLPQGFEKNARGSRTEVQIHS